MKIALIAVDSKIPNLALMKLSAWHKAQGDSAEVFSPLFSQAERVYASKVFKFTTDFDYFPENAEVIKGGSGYDLANELPQEVENMCPDYEIFDCKYALGFTSRGCIRKCQFCIVPAKEGKARPVADIYDFWRGQQELVLLDNNLTALPEHFEVICKQLIKERVKVDFSQGLDIRLINADMAQLLSKVKTCKQIHFAFDNVRLESAVRQGIKTLTDNGVKPWRLMFYVLIGYDSTPEEDLHRVDVLRGLGVDPFVMPYDKTDSYQRKFARWVNHKAIFKKVAWEDYLQGGKQIEQRQGNHLQ